MFLFDGPRLLFGVSMPQRVAIAALFVCIDSSWHSAHPVCSHCAIQRCCGSFMQSEGVVSMSCWLLAYCWCRAGGRSHINTPLCLARPEDMGQVLHGLSLSTTDIRCRCCQPLSLSMSLWSYSDGRGGCCRAWAYAGCCYHREASCGLRRMLLGKGEISGKWVESWLRHTCRIFRSTDLPFAIQRPPIPLSSNVKLEA